MVTKMLDPIQQKNKSGNFGKFFGMQKNLVEAEHVETAAHVVSSCLVNATFHIWIYSGK